MLDAKALKADGAQGGARPGALYGLSGAGRAEPTADGVGNGAGTTGDLTIYQDFVLQYAEVGLVRAGSWNTQRGGAPR